MAFKAAAAASAEEDEEDPLLVEPLVVDPQPNPALQEMALPEAEAALPGNNADEGGDIVGDIGDGLIDDADSNIAEDEGEDQDVNVEEEAPLVPARRADPAAALATALVPPTIQFIRHLGVSDDTNVSGMSGSSAQNETGNSTAQNESGNSSTIFYLSLTPPSVLYDNPVDMDGVEE